jgi:hypothetical protein
LREAAAPELSNRGAQVVRPARRTARAWVGVLLAAGLAAVVVIPHWSGTLRTPGMPAEVGSVKQAPGPSLLRGEAGTVPILTLLADVDRGATTPTLHWRADVPSVRLQAEVPGSERGTLYSIRIYDRAGHRLFEGVSPAHTAGHYRFVDIILPSTILGPGPRTIALQAADAAQGAPADYTWHVVGVLD